MSDTAERAQRVAVLDDDEVPRLRVHRAAGQPRGFHDPSHDRLGHGPVLIVPHGQECTEPIEDIHVHLFSVVIGPPLDLAQNFRRAGRAGA